MTAGSIVQRSWRSFIGGRLPRPPRAVERGRHGYSLWQRAWASFIGFDLPTRLGGTPAFATLPPPHREQSPNRQPAGRIASGWFALPTLPSAGTLTAGGVDAVALETSSPDGRVEFLVRHHGIDGADYRLELILRGGDIDEPLVTAIRYTQPDGGERVLFVPVFQGQFGPPASYVQLPGFGAGTAWTAAFPAFVDLGTTWDAATVAASVRAALNEATREAWRQLRELVDDDVRNAIDGALR
ncbi:hypothetical protein [Streptomyces sp. NBC_01089]|uniref:hypothetical protein n=1 Tax=Streptomyces sp. NBC_01089 TaxID=2903747 RepID=UPI00386E462B|nr:hypothetical protein OG510_33115 [Streptomyces sp. NBC_01089]